MPKTTFAVGGTVLSANLLLVGLAARRSDLLPLLAVLVVAVPGGLLLAQRPQRGLLVLAALAPFDGLLLLVPEAGLLRGWKEALVLATLGAVVVAPASARAAGGRTLPGWVPGVAGLVALGVISALLLRDGQALLGFKINFFYLLVPVIAWRCPLDVRERDRLVTILLTAGVLTAAYGIAQQAMGPERLNAMGYEYNTVIRFTGSFLRSFSTFEQPFPFALFLMVVILLAVSAALSAPARLRSRVAIAVLPLLGLGLAATFVRAAWLGLALGLLLLGVHRHRILLAGVPIALLLVAFLPASVSSTAFSGDSSQERLETWSDNLDAVAERPLGHGIGSGGSAAHRAVAEGRSTGRDDALLTLPDNHYFKTLYELGVVGLWLFVLVLWSAYRHAQGVAHRARDADAALAWGIVAVIAASAVAALMANVFEIYPVDLLFWLLLGVAATIGDRVTEPVVAEEQVPVLSGARSTA